jgi:hypothetical protein
VTAERYPAPVSRLDVLPRLRSLKSLFDLTPGLARRPSPVTLGTAAITGAAVAGVTIAVSSGSSPTIAAVNDRYVTTTQAPGLHQGGHGAGAAGHAAAGQPAPAATGSGAASHPASHGAQPAKQAGQQTARQNQGAAQQPAASQQAGNQQSGSQQAASAQPFLIYDSTTPEAIPANQQVVATYATGPGAVPASQVAGRNQVIWIDIYGDDYAAQALDVEPGNASPSTAASWAYQRLTEYPSATAIIYTMISEWSQVQAAVATLPAWMQSHIRWWIADPTGEPHMVAGASATQWYWGTNYDISTAEPNLLTG